MNFLNMPLVNWGMGTALIIVFAVVCVILSVVIYTMVQSGKKKKDE
ncbi:hypothetical protein [Rasiella sp. SM2506]